MKISMQLVVSTSCKICVKLSGTRKEYLAIIQFCNCKQSPNFQTYFYFLNLSFQKSAKFMRRVLEKTFHFILRYVCLT